LVLLGSPLGNGSFFMELGSGKGSLAEQISFP